MADEMTLAVLRKLDESHQLPSGDGVRMFNLDFNTDVITIRGPSSRDHVVRFPEIALCDYLNESGQPITEERVVATLNAIYAQPERYGVSRLQN